MYSVSFAKHTLECSVIVFGVRGKTFVGEERRRVQELCVGLDSSLLEVVGVILSLCGVRSRLSTSFKCGKKWKECDRRCVR